MPPKAATKPRTRKPRKPPIEQYKRYDPGTPQADWFRAEYERFGALIDERRRKSPRPSNSALVGHIGGDAAYYLSSDELSEYDNATAQIAYQERLLARDRRDAKRAERLKANEKMSTTNTGIAGMMRGSQTKKLLDDPEIAPVATWTVPARRIRSLKIPALTKHHAEMTAHRKAMKDKGYAQHVQFRQFPDGSVDYYMGASSQQGSTAPRHWGGALTPAMSKRVIDNAPAMDVSATAPSAFAKERELQVKREESDQREREFYKSDKGRLQQAQSAMRGRVATAQVSAQEMGFELKSEHIRPIVADYNREVADIAGAQTFRVKTEKGAPKIVPREKTTPRPRGRSASGTKSRGKSAGKVKVNVKA